MAKKGKKSTASHVDVRSPKDIPAFESLLKKGPMAVVLVYADWCGHCKTFKDNVWNNKTLEKTNNLNTASVHYDMVDKTSMKNTKVNGYPSVFMVGNDKLPKEIPTPQSPEDLLNLDAKSGDVLSNNAMNINKNNVNMKMNTNVRMNTKNNNNKNSSSVENYNTPSPNMNNYEPAPPNALNDVVSAESNESANKQSGGNLLSFLTSYIQEPEPNQKGGKSRRHNTRRNRNRRSQTRRK